MAVLEGVSGLQDQRLAAKFNQEPAPRAVALSYFLSFYPNRVQAILRPRGCKGWTTISKHWPLPDETILLSVSGNESSVYGLRWGEQTRFAVLDIDEESKYHTPDELQKLQEKLAAVGLTATPYRSSVSGGWHLYLFFDEWSHSSEVQETLRAWLTSHGYEIRGGTLELFPCGNGLRLPLQAGFAWLDGKGEVLQERKELGAEAAISRFLSDLERNKRNWSEAKNRIGSQIHSAGGAAGAGVQGHKERLDIAGFDKLFNYRLIPENYRKGREYWQTGLTSNGQRHDAILCVEHYLWHGDAAAGVSALPGEWNDEPRYRLILAWLEKRHNGFCNHINRGKWRKVEAQVRRAVTWRRSSGAVQVRTPYPMTERAIERLIALYKSTGRVWSMDDFQKGNDGREEEAREKIRAAVQLLTDQGRRVTVRQLMRLTGCCNKTIKRHLDIWKISPVVTLPSVGGDKNPCADLISPGVCALAADGSCPSSNLGKKVLLVLDPGDSGDLGCAQEIQLPAASLGSAVAPPSPPQAAATFCLVADSAEQPCELAPIVLAPPFLLPGSEPTSEPPASRPSPAGSFGSLDAGALVRWYSGRTADGAGGLEPSCNEPGPLELAAESMVRGTSSPPGSLAVAELVPAAATVRPFGITGSPAGLTLVTTCHPVNLFADVISVHTEYISNSGFTSTAHLPLKMADRGCTQLWSKPLQFFVYHDVRGPPSCTRLI